jgi:hypothetical protein
LVEVTFSLAPFCREEPLIVRLTPVILDWSTVAELLLTVTVELALDPEAGVGVGIGVIEGFGVGVGVDAGALVGAGVGVPARFTVIEGAGAATEVTPKLSVTVTVTDGEPAEEAENV